MKKLNANEIAYVAIILTTAFSALACWLGFLSATAAGWRSGFVIIGTLALLGGIAASALLVLEKRKRSQEEK
jgi:hypothetical protein